MNSRFMVNGAMFILATALAFCLTVAEREQIRESLLDGLEQSLRAQVRRMIDVRHKDREKSPQRIILGMRETIEQYAASRRAVLQWSPPLCNPPLPTPRPNTG